MGVGSLPLSLIGLSRRSGLGGKCLYLLSYLTSPNKSFYYSRETEAKVSIYAPSFSYTLPKDYGMLSLASIRKPLGHKTSQFLYNNQSARGRNYLKTQLIKKTNKQMLAHWHQNNRLREQEVSSLGAVVNQEAALTLGKEEWQAVCCQLKSSLHIPEKLTPLTLIQNSIIFFLLPSPHEL